MFKKPAFSRSSMISVILVSSFAAQSAWAATYRESNDYSLYVQKLTTTTNGNLFSSLMGQFGKMLTDCGTAAGLTAGAAVIDTVPLAGVAKTAGEISVSGFKLLKYVASTLKLEDLPYFVKSIQVLTPVASKISTWTPNEFKAYLATALPHAGVNGVYAERISGALLGFHAEAPKDLASAVDTIGPHILGGGISAALDYGAFDFLAGLGLDRSALPEGKITREAYRATMIAANEGFSPSSACGIAKANLDAAMDEVLMRNHMIARPGEVSPTNGNYELSPAVATNRIPHPDSARPYHDEDNGGPDLAPRPVSAGIAK